MFLRFVLRFILKVAGAGGVLGAPCPRSPFSVGLPRWSSRVGTDHATSGRRTAKQFTDVGLESAKGDLTCGSWIILENPMLMDFGTSKMDPQVHV